MQTKITHVSREHVLGSDVFKYSASKGFLDLCLGGKHSILLDLEAVETLRRDLDAVNPPLAASGDATLRGTRDMTEVERREFENAVRKDPRNVKFISPEQPPSEIGGEVSHLRYGFRSDGSSAFNIDGCWATLDKRETEMLFDEYRSAVPATEPMLVSGDVDWALGAAQVIEDALGITPANGTLETLHARLGQLKRGASGVSLAGLTVERDDARKELAEAENRIAALETVVRGTVKPDWFPSDKERAEENIRRITAERDAAREALGVAHSTLARVRNLVLSSGQNG